ncbi:MAG: M28 family peptidase [Pontixanthobacter sp.]
MRGFLRIAVGLLALSLIGGCAAQRASNPKPETLDAIESELHRHIEILASDEFEGRRPGTEGERKTLRYLADDWEASGLKSGTNDPANPWLAPVELTVRTPQSASIKFRKGTRAAAFPDGQVRIFTTGQHALLADAPLMFVGHQGDSLDQSILTGRVAVMLWDHPERERQRMALLENGAAAVLAIVSEPAEFDQLVAIKQRGSYRLAGSDEFGAIDGLVSAQAAKDLLGASQFDALEREAQSPIFRPKLLNLTIDLELTSTTGTVRTHNLVAKLPGKNSDGKSVVLMAHWDHFGRCGDAVTGDLICNGAVDNASGLAVLSGVAKRLSDGPMLDRDIYFVATTAEEWGLLGAIAFTRDPPVPLDTIVAAFNIDTIAVAPRGGPVAIVGRGLTPLDAQIEAIARLLGREVVDNGFSDRFIRRQDGWVLLQRDVPSLMVSSAFADPARMEIYTTERYHRPGDETAGIELGGAAEDVLLHLALVRHFAARPAAEMPAQ